MSDLKENIPVPSTSYLRIWWFVWLRRAARHPGQIEPARNLGLLWHYQTGIASSWVWVLLRHPLSWRTPLVQHLMSFFCSCKCSVNVWVWEEADHSARVIGEEVLAIPSYIILHCRFEALHRHSTLSIYNVCGEGIEKRGNVRLRGSHTVCFGRLFFIWTVRLHEYHSGYLLVKWWRRGPLASNKIREEKNYRALNWISVFCFISGIMEYFEINLYFEIVWRTSILVEKQ